MDLGLEEYAVLCVHLCVDVHVHVHVSIGLCVHAWVLCTHVHVVMLVCVRTWCADASAYVCCAYEVALHVDRYTRVWYACVHMCAVHERVHMCTYN